MSTKVSRRNSLYGYPSPQAGLQQEPIVQKRDPNAADAAEIGCIWINTTSQSYFILTSSIGSINTWVSTTGGAETLTALTVNPGDITVTAGDVNITAGDLNMDPASAAALGDTSAASMVIANTLTVNGGTSLNNALTVAGDSTFNSDVTVTGDLTVNGDFDLTSAAAIALTTTSNTNPAISLTANGGTAETIVLHATQGTSNSSVDLLSTVGGVTLSGGLATVYAINLTASNAAGGMTFAAGTNGYGISATNGPIAVTSGTGAISISADAAATTVNIGTGAAVVKTISIGGTGANVIAIGNTQTAGSVSVGNAMTTGTITIGGSGLQTGTVSIAPGTGAQTVAIATGGTGIKTVNIATGAIDNVVTIGSATGAASLSLLSGTGNLTGASTGTLLLDSVGVLELNSSAGVISIGNDAVAQNINVGTGAAARTITIGNASGASSVVVNVGTGALNLGTSATAHATTVGSTTAGSTLILNTPVGISVFASNGLNVSTAGCGLTLPGGLLVLAGTGSPSGTITAPIGSLYLRSDPAGATSRAYINVDAGTGWTNITCAA